MNEIQDIPTIMVTIKSNKVDYCLMNITPSMAIKHCNRHGIDSFIYCVYIGEEWNTIYYKKDAYSNTYKKDEDIRIKIIDDMSDSITLEIFGSKIIPNKICIDKKDAINMCNELKTNK